MITIWCSRPLGAVWGAPIVGMLVLRWSLPGACDAGGALWVVILGDEYVMGLGWRLVGMSLGWRLIEMYDLCMSFISGFGLRYVYYWRRWIWVKKELCGARSAFCLHFATRVVVPGSQNSGFFSREVSFGTVTLCLLCNNFLLLGISI